MNSPILFELAGAGIDGPHGPVFTGLDWTASERQVTVLLGPAGSGKSALLRGLSGEPEASGWRYSGAWRHRGVDVRRHAPAPSEIRLLAQAPRAALARTAGESPGRWRAALDSGVPTLLLDEPTRGESAADVLELEQRLRQHAAAGAAIVVTHDVRFARQVADHVWLLCAGQVAAHGPAATFFAHPPNELSERFVRQGNCWPSGPRAPSLPSHFRWILPGRLAGMGRPGLLGPADQDLEAVASAGATLLVTLTEEPLPFDLRPYGLLGRHFPIRDMGVPSIHATAALCREIERGFATGGVVLHCHAGLGRTGTVLAAALCWLGHPPDEAIATLRGIGRSYIQTRSQEEFVRSFAAAVGTGARG